MGKKRLLGVIVFGSAIITITGILFLVMASVIFMAMQNPEAASKTFERKGISGMEELLIITRKGCLLYVPFFISGVAILKRKEWGRRLCLIVCLVALGVSLHSKLIIRDSIFTMGTYLSYGLYAMVLYYFNRKDVKKQFQNTTQSTTQNSK